MASHGMASRALNNEEGPTFRPTGCSLKRSARPHGEGPGAPCALHGAVHGALMRGALRGALHGVAHGVVHCIAWCIAWRIAWCIALLHCVAQVDSILTSEMSEGRREAARAERKALGTRLQRAIDRVEQLVRGLDRDAGRAVVAGQAGSPRGGGGTAERRPEAQEVRVAAESESGQGVVARETDGTAAAKEVQAVEEAVATSTNRRAEAVERRGRRGGGSAPAEFAPAVGDRVEA